MSNYMQLLDVTVLRIKRDNFLAYIGFKNM